MIIVVGSGLAAYTFVQELRRHSKEIPITMVTKDCGRYYLKPPLSSLERSNKPLSKVIMGSVEDMKEKLNVTIKPFKTVAFIHRNSKSIELNSGEVLQYQSLVLALGAEPIHFNSNSSPTRINSLTDYEKVAENWQSMKSIAIVGSGLIGTEFACDLSKKHHVTWLSRSPYPLEGILLPELGSLMKDVLAKEGVDFISGDVESIDQHEGRWHLNTANKKVVSDAVLMAIGLKPSIELAMEAEIKCNKGICVNQYGQTNDPCIYALGDCAEVCDQWHAYVSPLRLSAMAIVKTLMGSLTKIEWPAFPVMLKTPLLPTVVCLHPTISTDHKDWVLEMTDQGGKATLYVDGTLMGFMLMGSFVTERANLIKMVPKFL